MSLKSLIPMIASQISSLLKKLRFQLKKTNFNDMDPISTLTFLKKVGGVCDRSGIRRDRDRTDLLFHKQSAIIIVKISTVTDEN